MHNKKFTRFTLDIAVLPEHDVVSVRSMGRDQVFDFLNKERAYMTRRDLEVMALWAISQIEYTYAETASTIRKERQANGV